MNIKFSRHAKRRLKLYKINENDVINSINRELSRVKNKIKHYIIVNGTYIRRYKYPLKIIFIKKESDIIVITVYPLKKGKRK